VDLEAPAVGKRSAAVPTAEHKQRDISNYFCLHVDSGFLAKVFRTVALQTCEHKIDYVFDVLDRFSRIEF
jgi:hypothetical protein